jgi:signal transduction histidine kinase
MWPKTLPRSAGTRLANTYALFFCGAALLLATLAFGLARQVVSNRIDQSMLDEMKEIGVEADLAALISRRINQRTSFHYGLFADNGVLLAGNLAGPLPPKGWSEIRSNESVPEDAGDSFRALTKRVKAGWLVVSTDTDDLENISSALLLAYATTLALTGLLAVFGGRWLAGVFASRLDRLAATADDIAKGHIQKRMPVSERSDEFDRLSLALNHMLDRNTQLLAQQRQITNDMAHDLRLPLTRLQQRLEAGQLEAAQSDTNAMMEIVASLLRITELEEDGRTRVLPVIDLRDVTAQVVDAYQPIFEENGKLLIANIRDAAPLRGDAQLLSQLLSNLLENILQHTASGATANLAIEPSRSGVLIRIADDGPGVPEQEIESIFARFHRVQTSRAAKGHGLGLSLVKAIAAYHHASCKARNLKPGLEVTVVFPAATGA